MDAELEILGVKLKHYRVDAAMEIAEEYLSNDKLNTIGIVTMQMLMQRAGLRKSPGLLQSKPGKNEKRREQKVEVERT